MAGRAKTKYPHCPTYLPTSARASLRNGGLILDEPTDLPAGREVELVPADAPWNLTDEEVAQLQRSIALAARGA
jgi:hypothetical protein